MCLRIFFSNGSNDISVPSPVMKLSPASVPKIIDKTVSRNPDIPSYMILTLVVPPYAGLPPSSYSEKLS